MSASRIVIIVVAVILIGVAFYAMAIKNEKVPSKTPGLEAPGNGEARVVIKDTKAEKVVDQLKISASTPSGEVTLGKPLALNLSVENADTKPRELTFNSGQNYDVRVEDESGHEVWRWSKGRMFTQMIVTVIVEPGKSISYKAEWPLIDSSENQVKPGDYNIFTKVMANGIKDQEMKLGVRVKAGG